MSRASDLLIIGAGPTGLALAMAYGPGARLVESSGEVGGLCRSVSFGGGVFDLGGHSFHSPHHEVTALVEDLMAGGLSRQRRDARVWFQGKLLDYPFQDHVHQIADAAVRAECEDGLATRGRGEPPAHFEDWIVHRFGRGVARHFMLPYNRKLWARDLRRMSCDWVGERIAGGDAGGGNTAGRRPLQSDSQVAYPAEGGFVAIFEAMARRCGPVAFGQQVCRIDPVARTARTLAGDEWSWRRLVSTMPAPQLLRAVEGCPADLIAAADRLGVVSLKILLTLVAGPVGAAPQRVYVPGDDSPIHKLAFNHTSSADLRDRPVHALMGEIAWSAEKPAPPDATLRRASLDWLADSRLIGDRGDVIDSRIVDVPYGYPVATPERPAIMARIRDWLAPLGIHTVGRFGGWDYVNSDACIWQGIQLAAALRQDAENAGPRPRAA